MPIRERPVLRSVAPDATKGDFDTSSALMNLVPSAAWRRGRRVGLLHDVLPKAICRQVSGSDNVYWLFDKSKGVLVGWNATDDSLSVVRLLPTSPGAVTAAASSQQGGYAASRAFDGNPATDWRPTNWTAEQWIQGTLVAASNVDSVKVSFAEAASGGSQSQTRVRGIRIRPSSHQDTTRTAAVICQELVDAMVVHNLNRAYVFVYEMPAGGTGSFWFNTGTPDYTPFGSDGADFLSTFLSLASGEGIEVFASLPYPQNYVQGVANNWGLVTKDGGVHSQLWLCPSKSGVLAWIDGIIAKLLPPNYAGLDGIDFAEPEWGFSFGNQACWCSACQAAFAVAYPGETFGETSPEGVYTADNPTITTWEQWRANVMTAALCADIAAVKAVGMKTSVVQFFGVNPDGRQLDIKWKLALSGFSVNGVLDNANAPDEFVWQMTWQEKAAGTRDYVTFSPEWTEYGVRWALANHNGRSAKPVVHVGGYSTVGVAGTDFSYGYDHTLTAAEHLAALKGAARGGAIHFEGYAWHTFEDYSLWPALDDFWTSNEYNAVTCEVQWNDGGTWRPIGRQAWFNTRSGFSDWLAHFGRKSEDQLRVVLRPAPGGNREVYVNEVEFRAHSVQSVDLSNVWGGIDFDNKSGGSADLWAVRYTTTQAYMHRIDEATGLNVGASPYAFDNYGVHSVNDLCVLPTGNEPRLLVLNQGDRGARATLHRYSTSAPGTLVSSQNLYLGGNKTAYAGLAHQPSSVDGTEYLVICVNDEKGPRFFWVNPSTLAVVGSFADSEVSWLWVSGMCWANIPNDEFLLAEASLGALLLKRLGKLQDFAASDAAAGVVTWTQAALELTLHPETALAMNTGSRNRLRSLTAYVWVDAVNGYGCPDVAVYAVSADAVETLLGAMTVFNTWGHVQELKLDLANVQPECQYVKFALSRAAGATKVGVLEIGGNLS